MNPRSWSFLVVDGARQYGGNAGYADDPSRVYRYDSDVANHLQIQKGDVVVIRSKSAALGIARITEIVEKEGMKERLRCPFCRATNIKERSEQRPRWRCKSGHLFDDPLRESVSIRKFEAHYADTFRSAPSGLTATRLLEAVIRPSDQMSIKEIDLAKIESELLESEDCHHFVIDYAENLIQEEGNESEIPDGLRHSIIESRRRVLREISVRRGQLAFRERLIRRYGCICQVSKCRFAELIEAAHVSPYAQSEDNSVDNGLLLRTDIHTLFDLALLAIHPVAMTIAVHPGLLAEGYGVYSDAKLSLNGSPGPNRTALEKRWELFIARGGLQVNSTPTTPTRLS